LSRLENGFELRIVDRNLLILFDGPRRVLSSAVLNGGFKRTRAVLNHQVSKDFDHRDPEGYLRKVVKELGMEDEVVGLMTAADVSKYGMSIQRREDLTVTAIVTAGASNAATCGEPVACCFSGTINTIVLIGAWMSDSCMVEAVKTATEAKCRALAHLDVRSAYGGELATGTTTDAVAIVELGGARRFNYCGSGTKLGELIGRAVFEAVVQALERGDELRAGRGLLERLRERGITLEDMVNAGLEMFVPHPGVESKERAAEMLREELVELASDVNVCSLVLAGLRLEEDARRGLIPGLAASSYSKDPVFLVADEVLGMSIANYAAGTLGVFEYMRFDRAKPGVLKRLGPFVDDIVGALIASASSRMYSRALRGRGRA
jgi:alpha-ribazole phosphatase CobZ